MEIYGAGEDPIPGVTARRLYEAILQHGHKDVTFVEDRRELVERVGARLKPGDMVITLGAGDVWKVGEALIHWLKTKGLDRKSEA